MQDDDPYNGKVLLAAVICLSAVVIFVILLHAYGRWLLRGSRTTGLSEVHLPGRWSSAAEEVGFSGIVNGLDAKVVAALPEFVYRAAEQQGRTVDCVVCLSPMDEGERGRILPRCGHGFHAGCIDAWLTAQSTCPICRAAVAAQETEEVVVLVDSDVFPAGGVGVTREVSAEVAVEMPVSGGQESSSSTDTTAAEEATVQSSSGTSSLAGCSLKRMLKITGAVFGVRRNSDARAVQAEARGPAIAAVTTSARAGWALSICRAGAVIGQQAISPPFLLRAWSHDGSVEL